MRIRAGIFVLAQLMAPVLAGCPGQGAASGRTSASDEPGRAVELTPPVAAVAQGTAAVEAAALPEGLVLAAEPDRDGVVLVIQNRSERPVELVLDASIERVGSESGAVPEGLRLDCGQTPTRCLSLVPGAELRPAAWPGTQARAQCGSGARAAAAPGRYRFAVRACSATGPAGMRASEPFELR
jgi:hypothetical protein